MGISGKIESFILIILLSMTGMGAVAAADPGTTCELQWLHPEDMESLDRYTTYSYLINDDWLMLGTALSNDGEVYIYRREGLTWAFDEVLLPDVPGLGDSFGNALALDNDRLLVGAPKYDPTGDRPGAVYAFRRIGGSWVQEEILIPGDEPVRSWFGSEIAISGNLAAVGAPSRESSVPYAGAIYIFEDSGSGWEEVFRITHPDPAEDDQLGQALAFAGERLIAGVSYRNQTGPGSGVVYVYGKDGSDWVEEAAIWPNDIEAGDAFGYDVAADGDRFLASAILADGVNPSSGRAHVYRYDGANWQEEALLVDSESEDHDYFGYSVDFSGNRAVIGIPSFDIKGACLIYQRDGAQWLTADRISPVLPYPTSDFGSGLSYAGGFLLVCGIESATVYGTTPDTCCPMVLVAPGPAEANLSRIRAFDIFGNPYPDTDFDPYDGYGYGARLITGDFYGTEYQTIFTGPGPGENNPPEVRRFTPTGTPNGSPFTAYTVPKYGVNVACGDLNGDGSVEVVTGAGPGAVFGPHVRGWEGLRPDPMPGVSFMAYGTNKFGVNVACGDIDADGYDEIVTGAGPGAVFGPHVRGWNVDGGPAAAIPGVSFLAYGTNKYGVRATCGDVDMDGIDEIVTTPGPGAVFGSHVRGWNYDGQSLSAISTMSFFAYDNTMRYGADAALLDR